MFLPHISDNPGTECVEWQACLWKKYLDTTDKKPGELAAKCTRWEALADALSTAREMLLSQDPEWVPLLKAAINHTNNDILHWTIKQRLMQWIDDHNQVAHDAFSALWHPGSLDLSDRLRAFDQILPTSIASRGATGTQASILSFFMAGFDPQQCPPYRHRYFRKTYAQLWHPPSSATSASGEYTYALDFLDRILAEARKQDKDHPENRLQAAALVWYLNQDSWFTIELAFEEFVAEAFRQHQDQFTVCVQGPVRPLATDTAGSDIYWLKPDIALMSDEKVEFLLDTKCFPLDTRKNYHGVKRDDMYQLFIYGKAYDCKRVMLIYPACETFQEPVYFAFAGKPDLELACFPFDVCNPGSSVHAMMKSMLRDPSDQMWYSHPVPKEEESDVIEAA